MKSPTRHLVIGFSIFSLTFVLAVIGYVSHGWPWLDAIYMVVITVFSVGYSEVHPVTEPDLRIMTIAVILTGCTSIIYLTGALIQFLTAGQIKQLLGSRRMINDIKKLNGHVIVCGYGRIGRMVAEELGTAERPFVIVERNEDRLTEAQSAGYLVYEGDATNEKVLIEAGVERASLLATVLPNDALNVFITLSARNLNSKIMIIARGEEPATERKLRQAGANHVVLPTHIGAERIAHMIMFPHAAAMIDNEKQSKHLQQELSELGLGLEEFVIPEDSQLVGAELHQVEMESQAGFLVVAIHKPEGMTILEPPGSTKLSAGDGIVVVCHKGIMPDFKRRYLSGKKTNYRGATG